MSLRILKAGSIIFSITLCSQAMAATEIGFKNEVPNKNGWVFEGKEPLKLLEENRVKTLDFNDSSDSSGISLLHTLDPKVADAMAKKGFVLKIRLRSDLDVPEHGNTVIVDVRLKELAPMALVFWHAPGWQTLGITSYDIVANQYTGLELPNASERYIDVTARFVPDPSGATAGRWSVEAEKGGSYEGAIGFQSGGQGVVQISSNHSNPDRHSRWQIESFLITVP